MVCKLLYPKFPILISLLSPILLNLHNPINMHPNPRIHISHRILPHPTIQMPPPLKHFPLIPIGPKRIPQQRIDICALRVIHGILTPGKEEDRNPAQPGHIERRHEVDRRWGVRHHMPFAAHRHKVCKRWHGCPAKKMRELGVRGCIQIAVGPEARRGYQ